MKKKIALTAMLVILFMPVYNVQALWHYDFNYDDEVSYAEIECYYAEYCFQGETYDGSSIDEEIYENLDEDDITTDLLGVSKLFHQASHGGNSTNGNGNYLCTHTSGERIYLNEIPDLDSVTGGGNQLLGFASCCYSGLDHPRITMLHDEFIGEGSEAYMGYNDVVNGRDAYYFACAFYDNIVEADTIEDAIDDALAATNDAVADILEAYGDLDIELVDS